jgi:subtilisin family serine protease
LANNGGGSYAGIISGIDYVRSNAWAGDVANMSLGGPASSALDNAVINLANKGVWCIIAAGNDYRNANSYSPARVNGTYIYTVSSHDVNNRFSTFSNYGNPPIDWCAPGTSIYSTWINSSYRTISGTSMATPHVAGIRIMGAPRVGGYVSNDSDGSADRRAVR